jgi:hypothetical protein
LRLHVFSLFPETQGAVKEIGVLMICIGFGC